MPHPSTQKCSTKRSGKKIDLATVAANKNPTSSESVDDQSPFTKNGLRIHGDFRLVLPHHPKLNALNGEDCKQNGIFPTVHPGNPKFPISWDADRQVSEPKERRPRLDDPKTLAGAIAPDDAVLDDNEIQKLLVQHFEMWSDADHKAGKKEIVASTFMRGRALYISSVGFEAVDADTEKPPLRLLMVSRVSDPWELSRLIFRLFMLGTLRLMAVRQMPKLYIAGFELDRLERDLLQVLEGNHVQRGRTSRFLAWVGLYDITNRYRARLARIQTHGSDFSEFGSGEEKTATYRKKFGAKYNGRDNLVGGLRLRVQRSSYYSSSYKSRMTDLHEGKIVGYQSYGELMRRRLFASFNFVASLEGKIESVNVLLDRLSERLRLRNAVRLNIFFVLVSVLALIAAWDDFYTLFTNISGSQGKLDGLVAATEAG
ncbi:MAG: hypothetical protein AAGF60_02420 [Pseudomonadota bacterium]